MKPADPVPSAPPLPLTRPPVLAHVIPLILFMALQAVPGAVRGLAGGEPGTGPLWTRAPELWVYPLQTLICAAALAWGWRHLRFTPLGPRAILWGLGVGALALAIWISPQAVFGAAARTTGGFDPTPLADQPGLYVATLVGRFLRLVVVVPLVEEIFWRGFLLRFLVREDFEGQPFVFTPLSFGVVCGLFVLEHNPADWPAAAVVGVLYNVVAIRTQSLGACVLAHAVTNGLLGGYILLTRQWGFW